MDSYYFNLNEEIVQDNDRTIAMTWDESGVPTDVSSWEVHFKAEADWTTDTIVVLPAAVTTLDSGTGTIDTFVIELTGTHTNVAPGFYNCEVAIDRGGNVDTVAMGTITITARIVEV